MNRTILISCFIKSHMFACMMIIACDLTTGKIIRCHLFSSMFDDVQPCYWNSVSHNSESNLSSFQNGDWKVKGLKKMDFYKLMSLLVCLPLVSEFKAQDHKNKNKIK